MNVCYMVKTIHYKNQLYCVDGKLYLNQKKKILTVKYISILLVKRFTYIHNTSFTKSFAYSRLFIRITCRTGCTAF
jgi:hypothetical protein